MHEEVESQIAVTDLSIKRLNQWICWDLIDGKKIPKNVHGRTSGSNRIADYVDYRTAYKAAEDLSMMGPGWCFMPNGGYCGLDLDDCLLDVFDEDSFAPWAVPIIERLNATGTYYERSPSFTGIKAWFIGELPTRLRKVKTR
ncbi:MAG: hypothetical protein O2931_16160, partial [Planctomycetota bacterium]|nr:hypothetical protein [Planctomycetota bacterium]